MLSQALLLGLAAEASVRCSTRAKNAMWNKPWMNLELQHIRQDFVLNMQKEWYLLQNTGVWLIFSWIIENQEVCCKGAAECSGFDSEALSCDKAFHTSHSNRHTGCLAMVQCFNTKRFSFLFTKANLLCSWNRLCSLSMS